MNNNMMMGNGMNNLFAGIRNFLGINRGMNNGYNTRCTTRILTMEDAYMQIMSGNTKVLDVRTENEYKVMRIKGAINIPINILGANIQNILPNRQECILIYCSCGPRAAQAVQIMKNMGYTNLCIWEGAGINNFKYKDIIERYDDKGDRVVVN
jgi:rhodanese-related sulfurtransferase